MTEDLARELERVLLHTDKPKVGLVRPEADETRHVFPEDRRQAPSLILAAIPRR